MKTRRRVGILGTGGTLAMLGDDSLDLVEYGDGTTHLATEALIDRRRELWRFADIEPIPFPLLRSHTETPETWRHLGAAVHTALESRPELQALDGIVITHGTVTMEEAAFFLHLTVPSAKPIVFVGAQRPLSAVSTDADMNLVRAVQVAADPQVNGAGVLVVLDEEIHSARHVSKTTNHGVGSFKATGGLGPLGFANADLTVSLYRRETRRHTTTSRFALEPPPRGRALARVEIVYSYGGAEQFLVDACVSAGVDGIVLASLPPGLIPPAQEQALRVAQAGGVAVVVASRGGASRMLPRKRYQDMGFVVADDLTPQAARILTLLALSSGGQVDLQEAFNQH